jgi:hypothetical protein
MTSIGTARPSRGIISALLRSDLCARMMVMKLIITNLAHERCRTKLTGRHAMNVQQSVVVVSHDFVRHGKTIKGDYLSTLAFGPLRRDDTMAMEMIITNPAHECCRTKLPGLHT